MEKNSFMENLFKEKEKRFNILYEKYVDEIYKYVYMRTGMKRNTAEDITQEIFIAIYRGLYGFKGLSTEKTWIYRIASHKLMDYYRKVYKEKESISLEESEVGEIKDTGLGVEDLVTRKMESYEISQCLQMVPEHYRIVLTLRYMDEKSVKEIAGLLQKTPKAIESLLQRAKSKFYEIYKEKEWMK